MPTSSPHSLPFRSLPTARTLRCSPAPTACGGAWLYLAAASLAGALLLGGCSGESTVVAGAGQDTAADADPLLLDMQDPTCKDSAWQAPARAVPLVRHATATSDNHIPAGIALAVSPHPPSSGTHRPDWAKWGEYSYLPPQRWLHNLEHGGVALLYHPCAGKAVKEALYKLAKSIPDDATGRFRFVLTPYPELPSAVAAVTWEWTWLNDAVDETSLKAFFTTHYRKASEDVASNGGYDLAWLRD